MNVKRLFFDTVPSQITIHSRLPVVSQDKESRASFVPFDEYRIERHQPSCRRSNAPGGELLAFTTGGQISSRLLSMRSANALLELPQVVSMFVALQTHSL